MKNEVASNDMHDQAIDVFSSNYSTNEGCDTLQNGTNNIFQPHDFIVKSIYGNVYVYF